MKKEGGDTASRNKTSECTITSVRVVIRRPPTSRKLDLVPIPFRPQALGTLGLSDAFSRSAVVQTSFKKASRESSNPAQHRRDVGGCIKPCRSASRIEVASIAALWRFKSRSSASRSAQVFSFCLSSRLRQEMVSSMSIPRARSSQKFSRDRKYSCLVLTNRASASILGVTVGSPGVRDSSMLRRARFWNSRSAILVRNVRALSSVLGAA